MSYKVHMKSGEVITIADATRCERNGSGTYLYDSEGNQIASFGDGEVRFAIPADSTVEQPAPAPEGE